VPIPWKEKILLVPEAKREILGLRRSGVIPEVLLNRKLYCLNGKSSVDFYIIHQVIDTIRALDENCCPIVFNVFQISECISQKISLDSHV
jgi:hypothetical protein